MPLPSNQPERLKPRRAGKREVLLVANGDLRLSANQKCWPAQKQLEDALAAAVADAGYELIRAHPVDDKAGHGFIGSQSEGMRVFAEIDPDARLIVAEAVWQYSHHLLAGLISHKGPILTAANWSGTWPGLVGLLNLNASLTKAGVSYDSIWADDYGDGAVRKRLATWLRKGHLKYNTSHVTRFRDVKVKSGIRKVGERLAKQLRREKAILGVFDEGCMGMYNAILPDELLFPLGVYKERLSQSALYYESRQVSDADAAAVRAWLEQKGLKFEIGPDHATDLTDAQIQMQCRMYIAAVRLADDFGCASIGIQYQQGLKDLMPASDLVEGMLNNRERPPVHSRDGSRELYTGEPLPHFNEVDECAGLDGLMTYRLHTALGQPVENTLHDLRYGAPAIPVRLPSSETGPHTLPSPPAPGGEGSGVRGAADKPFVWVLMISGAAPPAHFIDGWAGATSVRQPPMYFPSGGGTLRGVSRPGEIIWSRVYVAGGRLRMDLGRGEVVNLPAEETERRWQATTPQWPIMHAVTYGVSRDQMMARHKSNHIQVAYASDADAADRALLAKACMVEELGMDVSLCGTRKGERPWA
jgi:hypothetical protein